jgi:hypothetical protein
MRFEQATWQIADLKDEVGTVSGLSEYIRAGTEPRDIVTDGEDA